MEARASVQRPQSAHGRPTFKPSPLKDAAGWLVFPMVEKVPSVRDAACDDRCMSRAGTVSGKLLLVVAALAVVLIGCGSTGVSSHQSSAAASSSASPGVPAAVVNVIRGWSDALHAGHVAVAARYFRVPSLFFAGDGAPIALRSFSQVEVANAALPCGAKYLSAHRQGPYVNALFRLTNRFGPGGQQGCGSGVGQTARVNFLIRDGRIVQWLRAPDAPGENGSPRTSPPPSPPAPGVPPQATGPAV